MANARAFWGSLAIAITCAAGTVAFGDDTLASRLVGAAVLLATYGLTILAFGTRFGLHAIVLVLVLTGTVNAFLHALAVFATQR